MAIAAGKDGDRRRSRETAIFDDPSGACEHRVARRGEAGYMGHLASGDEGEAGALWDAEEILQPRAGNLFSERGGGATGVDTGILVPGGGEPIGCECGRNGAADHPGVETSAGIAHDAASGIGDKVGDNLLRRRAVFY